MTSPYDFNDNMVSDGEWMSLRERIRQEWAEVEEHELDAARNEMSDIIETVQRKTGETVDVIEQKLRDWTS